MQETDATLAEYRFWADRYAEYARDEQDETQAAYYRGQAQAFKYAITIAEFHAQPVSFTADTIAPTMSAAEWQASQAICVASGLPVVDCDGDHD